jgi:hypothetical protein
LAQEEVDNLMEAERYPNDQQDAPHVDLEPEAAFDLEEKPRSTDERDDEERRGESYYG